MSDDPRPAWDETLGPAPSDDERAEATALGALLARPPGEAVAEARARDLALEGALIAALRVRATAHPETFRAPERVKAIAAEALDATYGRRGWRRAIRSPWAWAAAAMLVAAVGVGSQPRDTPEAPPISRQTDDVFTRAVEPGAASNPAREVFDARLHAYRDTLLGAPR
ncbi:MAG: hypothetical protein JNK72_03665 [Myxococcales bacterium]|nr:hypothetical protein [Myxococcales bacterium]